MPRIKSLVQLAVSCGVFLLDEAATLLRRIANARRPPRCVVLYYHSIPAGLRTEFARQMETLLRHAQPISAATTSALSDGGRYVIVTFDDAFENVFENAVPELTARRIPAAIFVVTGCIGRPASWMEAASGSHEPLRTMSVEQLLKLPDPITIGSHTVTHPLLTKVSEQQLKRELFESRATLEHTLGRKVNLFSFPHGAYQASLLETCREAGYDRVFTTMPVLGLSRADEFLTGRVLVDPSDWPLEFRLKLSGAYRWLPMAFALKRSIVSNPLARLAKRVRHGRLFAQISN